MKKHLSYLPIIRLHLIIFCFSSYTQVLYAQITTYKASLSGMAESPANMSTGTGTATVTVDATLNTMRVLCSFSGLTATTTASHIHAATAVANTGTAGVATQTPNFVGFPLGVTSGTYDNIFDMTQAASYNASYVTANGGTTAASFAALIAALDAGKAYFNIHSTAFPGGEIRGFLTPICSAIPIAYVNAGVGSSGNGSSWATPFKTLQEALAAANNCSSITQIWVAKGTYYPDEGGSFANNDRNASFTMKNGVAIYGGFAGNEAADYDLILRNFVSNETILSGDIDQNDGANFTNNSGNSYHVIYNNSSDIKNNSILDGFTVKGGNANGIDNNAFGGGMHNTYSSPSISNCLFTGNMATFGGGLSAYYNTQYSNPFPPFDNIKISKCTFSNNSGISGGGIYIFYNQSIIENTTFFQNSATNGGGLYLSDNSSSLFNVVFSENNASDAGGGLISSGSNLKIINATFSNNRVINSGKKGGGIYYGNDLPTKCLLLNSVFWGNTCAGNINSVASNYEGSISATNTDIQGLSGLTLGSSVNCIDQDPRFANAADSDGADNVFGNADDGLRLLACSPAINAGVNSATVSYVELNAPSTDLLGNARVGNTDMGAFEYQGNPIISPTGTANPSICSGLTTSLSANCIAGTVSWYASDGTTFLQSGSPYGTPNLTSPSSYKVRCEDGGCLSDFVMVNVSIVAPPTVTITGGSQLTCSITSVSRTASGGGSYSWSNALGSNALANITTAGTYTVTVTGTNSCTATASTIVTKINDLIVTASNDGPYNEGDNINLTGTGGSTYTWTGPNSFTSLLTNPTIFNATPANAGIYTLTVNAGSCIGTATTQVNISCSNPGMSYFLAYSGETPEIIALLEENLMVQESIKPMTIIAVTNCELPVIESARLQLSGVGNNYFYVDNNQPFALYENNGQLSGEVLVPTLYTFISRGYDQDNSAGNVIVGPDVIQFLIVSGNRTISTPTTNIQSVCGGGSITVSANQTGSFDVGNVFQAYLSDADGKFGSPTLIGVSANPNAIHCTIPNISTNGTNYKIMIRSSAPVVSSLATIANISITSTNVNVNLVSPTNDLLNSTKTEKASASMNATNKIFGSSNVQYKAGNQIVLQPGFSATSGTVFLAKIENVCSNP